MGVLKVVYVGLNRVSVKIGKAVESLAGLLIAACACALFFQVIYRFIIVKFVSFSFPFTEEFARYALIWCTYLSLGLCLKEGSMAAVNLVYDRLHGKAKLALYILTRLMMITFLAVALIYGIQNMRSNMIFKSPTLKIPGIFLYSAPVAGCVLMAWEWLVELIGVLCGECKPFAAGAGGEEEEGDA